jgi:hypothetical protein
VQLTAVCLGLSESQLQQQVSLYVLAELLLVLVAVLVLVFFCYYVPK